MGRIDNYVETLSDEERKQYKELIQECKEREDELKGNLKDSREKQIKFKEEIDNGIKNLEEGLEGLTNPGESLQKIQNGLNVIANNTKIIQANYESQNKGNSTIH